MKKQLLLFISILLITANSIAQTSTFDIATFIPPPGWQRVDSNGMVLFHDYRTQNGMTSFCQLFLFPSRASNSGAVKNFQAEWDRHVVRTTGAKKKPTIQTEKTPDGWTAVTGYATITQQGLTYTCMLVSVSGFGKVMSILTNIAGQEYTGAIKNFLEHFDLHADNAITQPDKNKFASTGQLSDYSYEVPAGWIATPYPDGIVLSSAVSNTGEKCSITLWPMRPATGDIQNDATRLFNEVFKAFAVTNTSTPASMIKGTSAQGWDYFIIKKGIVIPGGDYQTLFGFVFVARLGNQVAAISGMSKDPLVSSCFGLQLTNVWPHFFYSLQFKNLQPIGQNEMLMKKITGGWMSVTESAGDRYVFAANGRYANAAAAQRYYRVSFTELLRVTDVFFGNGAYSFNGNAILLTADDDKANPRRGWFRLEQESRNNGISWTDKLYLLQKSVVDGSEYEVCYERQ